jgi:hypothetical protein
MKFEHFQIDAGKARQQCGHKQGSADACETKGKKDDGNRKAVSYTWS